MPPSHVNIDRPELHPDFHGIHPGNSHGLGEVRQSLGEVRADLKSIEALLASLGAMNAAVGKQYGPWHTQEGLMHAFLRALAEAISAALTGVWKVVGDVWTFVRTFVGSGSPAVRAISGCETTCRMPDVSEDDLAAGIQKWATRRARGEIGPLPRGTPATVAGWAASISRVEAEAIAHSPVERVRQHLSGRPVRGVRPVPAATRDQAQSMANAVREAMEDKPAPVSDLAARKAARTVEIRAALARTLERYEQRQSEAALAIYATPTTSS